MNSSPFFRPRALRASFLRRRLRSFCAALLIPVAVSASARAASEPSLITGEKKSFAYSWEQERQLGAETDKEITEQMGLYDNPPLQSYVQAVGERVLSQSEFANPNAPQIYRDTKFTFRVIDSPVVNAFAVPGGFVYVTRGLLSHLQNEAQLAVVLGHEIAHVAARHSSQQARRAQWGQLGAIAAAVLGQKVLGERAPNLAPTLMEASGKALQMFMLRYSREAEHESDQLGVGYASRAGYAAAESAHFFHALKEISAAEDNALPAWQSTHPDPGDRAQRVVQLAVAASPDGGANNVGEGEYLKHIDGIIVGEDPRAGFAENGVFYHPELRFQLPIAEGWKLDNQRSAVVFAEPSGRAMLGLRVAPAGRARDAATQFAQQNKVQVTASGDTTVNGLPASVIVGRATTEQGEVGVWNAFLEMDGRVYSLLGYAPPEAFELMRPTFERVAGGFAPLRLPENFAVQPARLKLVRADRAAPFASFVPTSLPPELAAEDLAHMNQVKLAENVNEGKTLKVVDAPPRPSIAALAAQTAPAPAPAAAPATAGTYGTAYPTNPPRAPAPAANYPPASTYPAPTGQPYPPQPANPASTSSTYPPQSTYPNYPQTTYPPQQYPPRQPAQTGYPPQPYPPASSQPQQPAPSYPQYPPAQPGAYPQPQPGTYPQPPTQPARPQWPQPGAANQSPSATPNSSQPPQPAQPARPSQPVWPR